MAVFVWDYFVALLNAERQDNARDIDEASLQFFEKYESSNREAIEIRNSFISKFPKKVDAPPHDFTNPRFDSLLPVPSRWLGLEIHFELLTPWYSHDDRVFHLLENPVRKDRVFGAPFMAASSWKGLLRWACRVEAGLLEYSRDGKSFEQWQDPEWIIHLFGNERGEQDDFCQGALVFYPTWFDKVDIEVINPHSRERRAGTMPVYYEVVPGRRADANSEGGKGVLYLLYAPHPRVAEISAMRTALLNLVSATEKLLTEYGISAKRTAGWGTAEIKKCIAYRKGKRDEIDSPEAVKDWVARSFT